MARSFEQKGEETGAGRGTLELQASAPRADELAEHILVNVYFGELETGDRLPSVRELARQLDVAKSTAHRIYLQLEQGGLLESRPGSGVYVAVSRDEKVTLDQARYRFLQNTLERARNLGMTPVSLIRGVRRYHGEEPSLATFGMVSAREWYEMVRRDLPVHLADALIWIPANERGQRNPRSCLEEVDYLVTTFLHRNTGAIMAQENGYPTIQLRLCKDACDHYYRPSESITKCLVFRDRIMVEETDAVNAKAHAGHPFENFEILQVEDPELKRRCTVADRVFVAPTCVDLFRERVSVSYEVIEGLLGPRFVDQLRYHAIFG